MFVVRKREERKTLAGACADLVMDFKKEIQIPACAESGELVLHNVDPQLGDYRLGPGTLFVAHTALSWVAGSDGQTGPGFTILYPDVHMHATSKDGSMHQQPCVFCMLSDEVELPSWWGDAAVNPSAESSSGSSSRRSSSLVLPVATADEADTLFTSISKCSAMHPDSDSDADAPAMGGSGPADSGEWFTASSFAPAGAPAAAAVPPSLGDAAASAPESQAAAQGVQLAHPSEYDEDALAAWEAKFVPPPAGIQPPSQ